MEDFDYLDSHYLSDSYWLGPEIEDYGEMDEFPPFAVIPDVPF